MEELEAVKDWYSTPLHHTTRARRVPIDAQVLTAHHARFLRDILIATGGYPLFPEFRTVPPQGGLAVAGFEQGNELKMGWLCLRYCRT